MLDAVRSRGPGGLRAESPVAGLARHRLGVPEVLAQSVSSAAPAAGMATVPGMVAVTAGAGTVWSFGIATVLALLVATCVGRFTTRMGAPGSLYSLTAKGLGPSAAVACCAALLAGHAALVAAALTGTTLYIDALLTRVGAPHGPPVEVAVPVALAAGGAALVARGIRVSARMVLAVEAVSIVLVVTTLAVLARTDGALPGPVDGGGLGGVVAGVLPALGAFIGFEAATTLGVEARRPLRTVPRAVLGTAAVVGAFCLLAAALSVRGPVAASGALTTGRAAVVIDLGLAASFLACTVATTNALVRVLFTMGRDGIAPGALGAAHPRYRTPHVAVAVALGVVAPVPAALIAGGTPIPAALSGLLAVATAGYLVAYLLVCVAAPVFLRRIGELTAVPVLVTAVTAPALAAVCVAFLVGDPGAAVRAALAALLVAALGWYGWLRWWRPDRLATVGVYDETSAADVLVTSIR